MSNMQHYKRSYRIQIEQRCSVLYVLQTQVRFYFFLSYVTQILYVELGLNGTKVKLQPRPKKYYFHSPIEPFLTNCDVICRIIIILHCTKTNKKQVNGDYFDHFIKISLKIYKQNLISKSKKLHFQQQQFGQDIEICMQGNQSLK